jgi:hypothetical protein
MRTAWGTAVVRPASGFRGVGLCDRDACLESLECVTWVAFLESLECVTWVARLLCDSGCLSRVIVIIIIISIF